MNAIASPASGPMPFSSTVGELPLPVALERLFGARSTGLLVLDARQGRHIVYVRDGYPVAVELPGSVELLGKVLLEMKFLDEATYQSTMTTAPPPGQRYGDVLLERGLITEDQLRQGLKAQVRRKLHRLFFLTDATITYEANEHHEGLQRNESLRVHPWRATYHGVRSAWNADRLRQALTPLAGKKLRTTLTPEELARFGLGAEDGRAAGLLRDQAHSVETLASTTGLPIQPVSALCYALYVAGGLQLAEGEGGALTHAAIELERLISARLKTIEQEDLFTVLGVERSATTDQIKTAYLEAARRFHPDRLAPLGLSRLRDSVEKIFRRVSEAQATLLDDARRAQYIESLDHKPAAEETAAHQQALSALQAELAFKRGQHLLKKNELVNALRDFEAALAAVPSEGEHVVYVAWTRRCLDQISLADAKTEVLRGLKLQPRCASGHYFLGMLYKDEDAIDAALASFRKAVTLDARQFDAEQEIRVLEARRARGGERRGFFDRFRKPGK